MLFCKAGIALAEQHPEDKAEVAYWIVSNGSYFGGLITQDKDDIRGHIRDLAMTLEVPDHVVYVGDGLSVKQKWRLMEELVNEGLQELELKK